MATPYELRFDMYNAALERQKDAYFSAVEQDRELQDRMGEAPAQRRFPTPKDVIEEANEIMAFVNGDKQ
jgi:hypothetical protein